MKHAILIIGDDLRINEPFIEYIYSHYKEKFYEMGDIKFISKTNKNLPFIIDKISSQYKFVCIFASNESYHIVSKILATLTSDLLELKSDNTLAPSHAVKISKDSFVIDINSCQINIIKSNPLEKLPKIILESYGSFKNFYIFDYDVNSVKILLEPLTTTYEIQTSVSQYSKYLTLVRAEEKKFGELDEFIKSVQNLFSGKIILEQNFIEFIVKKLQKIHAKITFAESCTAGLVASKIGGISGASEIFDGSLVTYSNEIKNIWLGVNNDILNSYGAVSKECVSQMLSGALEKTGASFALAISGIAGPSGGTEQKPVGTVFIGAAQKDGEKIVNKYLINGNRNYIRNESANIALSLLIKLNSNLFFTNYL